jgi:uncharacterized membrane protein YphA (DoxX/SURF4 family)
MYAVTYLCYNTYKLIKLSVKEKWVGSVTEMRRYNFWRPIMLIIVALLTRSLVTNVCILFGMQTDVASSIGTLGMVVAGLVMYNRMNIRRRK